MFQILENLKQANHVYYFEPYRVKNQLEKIVVKEN